MAGVLLQKQLETENYTLIQADARLFFQKATMLLLVMATMLLPSGLNTTLSIITVDPSCNTPFTCNLGQGSLPIGRSLEGKLELDAGSSSR